MVCVSLCVLCEVGDVAPCRLPDKVLSGFFTARKTPFFWRYCFQLRLYVVPFLSLIPHIFIRNIQDISTKLSGIICRPPEQIKFEYHDSNSLLGLDKSKKPILDLDLDLKLSMPSSTLDVMSGILQHVYICELEILTPKTYHWLPGSQILIWSTHSLSLTRENKQTRKRLAAWKPSFKVLSFKRLFAWLTSQSENGGSYSSHNWSAFRCHSNK